MPVPPPQAPPPSVLDDHALLRAFVAGDQAAFAALLQRHERMVFSASLRVIGDPGSAQDAAQQTFLLLSRHAARLRPPVVIGGWLYNTARHQAENLRRSMHRRHHREQRAAADLYDTSLLGHERERADSSSPAWHELSPHLDAALSKLPARLRDAVVLCLLENQDRATAAAQLNCSPDALAKRLSRALDQLRARLSLPGKPVTAAALAVLLAQHGSESHAATLAPTVLATPLAPAAATGLVLSPSFKLTTAAAILALGAMFVMRTSAPVQPPPPPSPTAKAPARSAHASAPVPPPGQPSAPLSASAQPPAPGPVADPLAYVPDDNPYRPALLAYARLAEAKAAGLELSSEEQQNAREAVLKSLAAGRATPEVDWGVDYTRGFSTTISHVGPANKLAKVVLEDLTFFATDKDVANLSLDIFALGRHLGRDGTLIEILSGAAVIDRAIQQLEPLIAERSPADSARLAAEIRKLPTLGTLETALAYEKTFFLDSIMRDFTEELATALGKLAPGSASATAHTPHSSVAEDALAHTVADLKLHGLVREGTITRVGLRSPTHTFWLAPAETRHGLTLLSANITAGNALLLVQNRPVLLNLSKGTFTVPAVEVLEAAARALPKDSLTALVLAQRPSGSITDLFNELDLAARQLSELYAEAIAHPERFTNEDAFWKRVETLSPTAQNAAVALPRIITRLLSARAREATLLAKLDARAAGAK